MFVMHVSASDIEDISTSSWIDLFDYSAFINTIYVQNESYAVFEIELDQNISCTAIDIVLYDSLNVLSSYNVEDIVSFGAFYSFDYNVYSLGDGYYRFYGQADLTGDITSTYFYFELFFPDSVTSTFTVLHWYVNTVSMVSYDIECTCDVLAYGYGATINYRPSDTINHREWEASSEFTTPFLQLDLFSSEWKKYDYIDYIVTVNCMSFLSIAAFHDGVQIPIDYDLIENSTIGTSTYTFSIRMDLRGLDRSVSSFPNIHIELQQSPGEYNLVGVLSCVGGISVSTLSPFQYFSYNLFSRLSSWIYSPLSTIRQFVSSISVTVSSIYNALSGPNQGVDHIGQQVQDKEDQLQDMVAEMNSVTRPPIDDVDGDVSDIISTDDLVLASQGLGNLIQNEIIISIFSMSLLLCLASYVFFGKK